MITKMNIKKKTLTALSIFALLATTFMCWLLLELVALVSIDDAMYAGWTQHGFKYFIERNIWHYNNFNSRVFVHIVMQLVLFFDEHLYAIIFPFFISGSTFILTAIIKKEWSLYQRLLASSLSLFVFISLGKTVLTDTAMWVAGGFNYVFPLLPVIAFYWLFCKFRTKNIALTYLIPLAFLAGATTEQYGMYVIGLIVMTYFWDTIDRKRFDFRGLAYLTASVLGLLTIMLGPPTLSRIDQTRRPLLKGILYNWSFLGGKNSTVLFPILFMLFVGLMALCKRAKTNETGEKTKCYLYNPLLICGIPFASIAAVFAAFNNYIVSAILTFLYVALASVTFMIKKETRELGKILVCGFGTFFMISITTMAAHRTCVPCILSFVVVLSIMFVDTFSEVNKKALCSIAIAALSCVCIFSYVNSYIKYKEENKFCEDLRNELKDSSETNVIELNFDETYHVKNRLYRNKTLVDMYPFYPFKYFQEKYNFSDNVKYSITSEIYDVYNICCDGTYSPIPAIKKGSSIYVPMMFPHYKEAMHKEFWASMLYNREKQFVGISMNGKVIYCKRAEILEIGSLYFVKLDYVLDQWEYDCKFDAKENTYIFTTSNE